MRKLKNLLILAGGDSDRFWPLTDKNMTVFLGKPFLGHHLKKLHIFFETITVVAHQSNINQVEKVCLKFKDKITIKTVAQKDNSQGMAGAILAVKGLVSGEVLIINASDLFNETAVAQLIIEVETNHSDLVFFAHKKDNFVPAGYVRFFGDKVVEIVEKPAVDKLPSNIVKFVVDYLADFGKFVGILEKSVTVKDDLYEKGLNNLISSGAKTKMILYEDYFFPLKFPWQILPLMKFFLSGIKDSLISTSARISKKALITGPVFIGDSVKIGDFSKIVGPAFIGDNTIIGDHTLIRESQIGSQCLVGGYSEVTRSYLGNQISLHRNFVGDSVLADQVSFGAGVTTANFRFDEKTVPSTIAGKKTDTYLNKLGAIIGTGTKVGVNSTTLPGIKIGQNTLIGPASLIKTDIDDKKFHFDGSLKDNLLK